MGLVPKGLFCKSPDGCSQNVKTPNLLIIKINLDFLYEQQNKLHVTLMDCRLPLTKYVLHLSGIKHYICQKLFISRALDETSLDLLSPRISFYFVNCRPTLTIPLFSLLGQGGVGILKIYQEVKFSLSFLNAR